MKRLGIYLVYDKQNIVDGYIGYFLKELKTCVSTLIVICNMEMIKQGEEHINQYADKIFFRKNVGFDAGGFKDVLCNLVGWETVLQYDELVLANDSMFGPFRPMSEIFKAMEPRDVDFWGLTIHGEQEHELSGHVPEHIQTFFLAVRRNMLHSNSFRDYWEEMIYYPSFSMVVQQYEMQFTQHFSNLGFTYSALADTKPNDSQNKKNNYCQFLSLSNELIKKRNFPFLKKKQLSDEYELLERQTQEEIGQAIQYIDKETAYDIDLIWENIIRIFNPADLQRMLHLQYIIASASRETEQKIVVFAVVSFERSVEYVLECLNRLHQYCSVTVLSDNAELLRIYLEHGYEVRRILFTEDLRLLAEYGEFDLVGVLHDTDLTSDQQFSCTGKSYFHNIWENLLKDEQHLAGIAACFEREPRLGFLASPEPNFAQYFGCAGKGWNGNFVQTYLLKEKLELNAAMAENKPPYRITNDFWIRGSILKKLKNIDQDDCMLLPYIWSYLAQDSGYYSGIVESVSYASINEVNLKYYITEISHQIQLLYGNFDYFYEMKRLILQPALKSFCSRFRHIYVYGAGLIAKQNTYLLEHFDAYVISDGQAKQETLNGIPIKYLSEILPSDDCGFVVLLNKMNQAQATALLETRGFKNYICF